ncbi:transcriptional regulator NanR [Thalassococcus lentus]|uniref:Transcriptional regulator NanR n=1 Tax=Thalassococcus lentus TaxID=1210524 RepID=A0ABT4XQQ2_9RHOB|nr:transcriptional regulator NanR [Thalassococcus lentus]MDA7424279.1 transcriptional regulator NanR [Thalassococcus lentus]
MSVEKDTNRRRKLSDEVRERLLELIKTEGLAPGDVIPSERALMAQFGVGRPVVREAMQSLQSAGLIDIRHGERPKVASPSMPALLGQLGESVRHSLVHSDTSLDDLKQARALFEAQMAGLAAANRTDRDIAALRDILGRQSDARENSAEFLRLDGAFHARIADMSGNAIFQGLSRSLFDWLAEFHTGLVRAEGHESVTVDEHGAILDAIDQGACALAGQRMSDHLNRANKQYRKPQTG